MSKLDYVSLHCHTDFSFKDSINQIDRLVAKAKALGQKALAITDHGVVHGHVKFIKECKKAGIKPILGIEAYFTPKHEDKTRKSRHITLLCKDQEGLANLYKMVTISNTPVDQGGGFFYRPRISWKELEEYHKGIICLTGCMNSPVNKKFGQGDYQGGKECAERLLDIFTKENLFVELQLVNDPIDDIERNIYIPEQDNIFKMSRQLAKELGLKAVCTNDCHYTEASDSFTHEVWKAIDANGTLDTPIADPSKGTRGRLVFNGFDYYVRSAEEMADKFTADEINQSAQIADLCDVKIEKMNRMPKFDDNLTDEEAFNLLKKKCRVGWKSLGINKKPDKARYEERIKQELKDIEEFGLQNYFLIVWDVIDFCIRSNIPTGRGRGSGAGSLVGYLLNIHAVDPIENGLIWERFFNRGRAGSPPDYDLDVCISRRDEVVQYIIQKFGQDRVFPMCTISTLAPKAAIKDVGKVLCLPFDYVNDLTDHIGAKCNSIDDAIKENKAIEEASQGIDKDVKEWRAKIKEFKKNGVPNGVIVELEEKILERSNKLLKLFEVAKKLEGCARQRSAHACALLIADKPIFGNVPLCYDSNKKKHLTAFDMYDLEAIGYLKLDILGLKTLDVCASVYPEGIRNITEFNDPKVYDLISAGDTKGVFQLESALGRKWCKKLQPRNMQELSDLLAIVRPAVLETGLADQYISNKEKPDDREILHPDLDEILKDSHYIMLMQESMLKIAQKFAGFNLSKADMLRKACVSGDSLIDLDCGPTQIKYVEELMRIFDGVKVRTLNKTNDVVWVPLEDIWYVGKKPVFKLIAENKYNNYYISATEDHLFYTPETENQWTPLKQIVPGMKVLLDTSDGPTPSEVISIIPNGYEDVYDFTVNDETPYAFIEGILVHNCGKKLPEEMAKYESEFVNGCVQNGYDEKLAKTIWEWINASASYSFNKSHSLAYAQLSYITAWLKLYRTNQFFLSLLEFSSNEQDTQEEVKELFFDAKKFGINVLPPSTQKGNTSFLLEGNKIYFGLQHIKSAGAKTIEKILAIKDKSWNELLVNLSAYGIPSDVMVALIVSGAFDHYKLPRKELRRQHKFINQLTEKEIDIMKDILLGQVHNIKKTTKKNTFEISVPFADTFRGNIENLRAFLDNENKEAKIITARRAETLRTICDEYLAESSNSEYSVAEKASYEKFYLGIPATCSNVDMYYHRDVSHNLICVEREHNRSSICTLGTVNKIKSFKDKNGNEMAFVGLEDSTYAIDAVVFSKTYGKFGQLLDVGRVLMFNGWKKDGSFIVNEIKNI